MFVKTMKKLQITIKNHLKPHKSTWMNKDIEVIIDKCYIFSFYIEQKYFDSVWCDVVSIDSCYILLRRL